MEKEKKRKLKIKLKIKEVFTRFTNAEYIIKYKSKLCDPEKQTKLKKTFESIKTIKTTIIYQVKSKKPELKIIQKIIVLLNNIEQQIHTIKKRRIDKLKEKERINSKK